MGSKLFVSNLSAHTTEAELLDLFGEVGTVVSVVISVDHRTGVRNNHAFFYM
jgi:RNA recognition motif-containing protein